MQIFIDTANLVEIEQAYSAGIADGITTNPSLIKKAVEEFKEKGRKIDIRSYIKKILVIARGTPVSLEVIGTTYGEMIAEGKHLFKIFNPVAKNVYIKIPVNVSLDDENVFDGVKAIRELSKIGIPINCTLIFTPEQALLAAKAGADIVSPFTGRIDDFIREQHHIPFKKEDYFPASGLKKKGKTLEDEGIVSGIDLIKECSELFRIHQIKSKILAASIRNHREFREVAVAGADIATMPLSVVKQLLIKEETKEGMKKFISDIVPEYAALVRGRT